VEADDSHVLLSSTLLGLDETGGAVNADNQAARDLGIESTTVTSLFTSVARDRLANASGTRIDAGAPSGEKSLRTGECA
jgi:deoxyribose-phosphate aldolase